MRILSDLKNVGKATLADLDLLGIEAAIIHEAVTGEASNWWDWTQDRKALQKSGKLDHVI